MTDWAPKVSEDEGKIQCGSLTFDEFGRGSCLEPGMIIAGKTGSQRVGIPSNIPNPPLFVVDNVRRHLRNNGSRTEALKVGNCCVNDLLGLHFAKDFEAC